MARQVKCKCRSKRCGFAAPVCGPVAALAALGAAFWAYELGWAWTRQGGLAQFCFQMQEFNYDQSGGIVLMLPFLRTRWVLACQAAFAELGTEQRQLLESLFNKPLPLEVLHSPMTLSRYWQQASRPGAAQVAQAKQAEREALRKALLQSPPRNHTAQGLDSEFLTREVLAHAMAPPDWLNMHDSLDRLGPPAKDPWVEPSEVNRALKEGRLVRFDATRLLPAHTFNVTLDDLSAMHPPHGDDITILAFLHESKKCRERAYASRERNPWSALACPAMPTLGQMRAAFPDPAQMPDSSRIALRRLPNYINETRMLEQLGMEGVERPEGQIIMGHAWGDTHWDEQDNIFIQVSGVAAVLGVAPEFTDAITGDEMWSVKSSGMAWKEWIEADEVRRKAIPWFYMVLKPGDGIAIPSRAFHAVYGSKNRASLQTFLEPKFHSMRWETNKDSYWHKESDVRQAVRNIFFKTIGRLWDERKIGMVAQGGVIEYL